MKRNGEKAAVENENQNAGRPSVEMPGQGGAASNNSCHAQEARPEIAVLGWDVRSYRLSLRQTKA